MPYIIYIYTVSPSSSLLPSQVVPYILYIHTAFPLSKALLYIFYIYITPSLSQSMFYILKRWFSNSRGEVAQFLEVAKYRYNKKDKYTKNIQFKATFPLQKFQIQILSQSISYFAPAITRFH